MDKNIFDQIINLIQNTGDALVIFDEKRGAYVIMNFRDYQKLVFTKKSASPQDFKKSPNQPLTEIELLDKINKEINLWKASQENKASEIEI